MDRSTGKNDGLEIQKLLKALGSKDGMERKQARQELVARGKEIIDFLKEFVDHPQQTYRWEAFKTMEEIGDPASIPLFIEALENDDSDLRWIAAKGLVKIGVPSITPILNALIEKTDSIFILAGAHHVFYDLKKTGKLAADFPIDDFLAALKNPERIESVKLMAYELLNNLESGRN